MIHWFITNYLKNNYNIRSHYLGIYNSYKDHLKILTTTKFDPFRRGNTFDYHYDENDNSLTINTTIGQLNFFKWIIENNIFDDIEENLDIILHNF